MSQTIAYITDTHLDEAFLSEHDVDAKSRWLRILNDVVEKKITSVVFGGDIGEPSAHGWMLDTLKQRGLHTRFTLGNHDRFDIFKKQVSHPSGGNGLFYAEEVAGRWCIFLDSSTEWISEEQVQWLALQVEGRKRLLVFIHHPILSVETPVDRQYPLHNRDTVKAILHDSKSNVTIFCGHYHMTDFREEGRIRQLITPAASYGIVKSAPVVKMDTAGFGYRLITIHPGHIETAVLTFQHDAFIPSHQQSFPF
jgi:Icc protein